MKTLWTFGCVVACLTLVHAAHAGSMLVGDGDFVDWTFGKVAGGGAPVALTDDAEMVRVVDAGNPAIENTTWSNTRGKNVWGFGYANSVIWDPGIYGALASIDFQIDFRTGVNPGGDGQAVALLIKQSGYFYTLAGGVSGVSVPLGSWNSLSYGPLTSANLQNSWAEGAPGVWPPLDSSPQTPDFSATGAPMQFGFAAGNHISGLKSNFYDNWFLELRGASPSAVPLPSAALPAALILAGFMAFRRVRRRRRA